MNSRVGYFSFILLFSKGGGVILIWTEKAVISEYFFNKIMSKKL